MGKIWLRGPWPKLQELNMKNVKYTYSFYVLNYLNFSLAQVNPRDSPTNYDIVLKAHQPITRQQCHHMHLQTLLVRYH